jgi:hypothetical protein
VPAREYLRTPGRTSRARAVLRDGGDFGPESMSSTYRPRTREGTFEDRLGLSFEDTVPLNLTSEEADGSEASLEDRRCGREACMEKQA